MKYNKTYYNLTDNMRKGIYLLVYTKKSKGEVAAELGINRDTVSEWFRKPHFIEAYDAEMRNSFKELAGQAKETMAELMNDAKSESVRLAASKEIVSRAGYDAPTQLETTNKSIIVAIEGEQPELLEEDLPLNANYTIREQEESEERRAAKSRLGIDDEEF